MTDTTTLDTGDEQQPQKRPVFLTVLCILTWVGSGYSLLTGAYGLLTDPRDEYNEIMNTPDPTGLLDGMAPYEDFLFWSNVGNGVGLLVAILCILGAVFMFQQKKNGILPLYRRIHYWSDNHRGCNECINATDVSMGRIYNSCA